MAARRWRASPAPAPMSAVPLSPRCCNSAKATAPRPRAGWADASSKSPPTRIQAGNAARRWRRQERSDLDPLRVRHDDRAGQAAARAVQHHHRRTRPARGVDRRRPGRVWQPERHPDPSDHRRPPEPAHAGRERGQRQPRRLGRSPGPVAHVGPAAQREERFDGRDDIVDQVPQLEQGHAAQQHHVQEPVRELRPRRDRARDAAPQLLLQHGAAQSRGSSAPFIYSTTCWRTGTSTA